MKQILGKNNLAKFAYQIFLIIKVILLNTDCLVNVKSVRVVVWSISSRKFSMEMMLRQAFDVLMTVASVSINF